MIAIAIFIFTVVGVSCDVRPHPLVVQDSVEKLIKTVPWTWKYLKTSMKAHGPITVDVDVISKYKLKGGSVKKNKILPHTKGRNGIYKIYPDGKTGKRVYCDMTTEGGGWTVILRRRDGSVYFNRDWNSYKNGFGTAADEYGLGNQYIYYLTKQRNQELRVDLGLFSGRSSYAKFSTFYTADESNKYKLSVGGYSGVAGDSLSYHNGMSFSTKDKDNDQHGGNCAKSYQSGWWYKSCHYSNLNGPYYNSAVKSAKGIIWYHLGSVYKSLKKATMMIRTKA